MKIIVCDDEKEYLECIKDILDSIAAKKALYFKQNIFLNILFARNMKKMKSLM